MEALIILNCSTFSVSLIDMIKAFQKIGWDIYNPKGDVEYLPVGDDDMHNWRQEKMTEAKFYDIVSDKIASNEQVGVNLFYNNGIEGVSLLANSTNEIILSIEINRRRINQKHTDMCWYLQNIIYKFIDEGVKVLYYRLEEYED